MRVKRIFANDMSCIGCIYNSSENRGFNNIFKCIEDHKCIDLNLQKGHPKKYSIFIKDGCEIPNNITIL